MWLKVVIVILFLANLVVLGSALYTLLHDQGRGGKRTAWLLAIRVSLAALLLGFVVFGFWSGQLSSTSPWAR